MADERAEEVLSSVKGEGERATVSAVSAVGKAMKKGMYSHYHTDSIASVA